MFSSLKERGITFVKIAIHADILKKVKKKKLSVKSTVTGREYFIEDCISCRTEGVVYLLEYPCCIQYIERTKRELWKRLRTKHKKRITQT